MTKELYLGVDPGRSKTGLALVDAAGVLKKYDVVCMEDFANEVRKFVGGATLAGIVLGNGTTSDTMRTTLQELFSVPLYSIEESHSTEEARALYWELYPPKGLKKLIPLGLRVPPINLDGLAAVILVRRFLAEQKN